MSWFGVRLTKKVFAGFFKKAIPLVGSFVGGGITYLSFKPCCQRLKDALSDTMLSNPKHASTEAENIVYDSILTGELDESVLGDDEDYIVTGEEE